MTFRISAALAAALMLAGCATGVSPPAAPSASDQRLLNHASEASAKLLVQELRLARGSAVWVDTSALDPVSSRYLAAAVRAHLAGRGVDLVDRAAATIVLELRVSAAGLDATDKVFGLAPETVPANTVHSGTPALAIPEISLWSVHKRIGVSEVSALAYDARTGHLVSAAGPVSAETEIRSRHFLGGFFTAGDDLASPAIAEHAEP